ncbi:hypothetical protein HAX54_035959 [Datura stramonium]|uniref:Uncharacterized protein n=1 Tax=Datura stramonium TaxID=4076 RepID=A0ABS8SG06_DATST|nr:hypothetical protein [Datura stramonium]
MAMFQWQPNPVELSAFPSGVWRFPSLSITDLQNNHISFADKQLGCSVSMNFITSPQCCVVDKRRLERLGEVAKQTGEGLTSPGVEVITSPKTLVPLRTASMKQNSDIEERLGSADPMEQYSAQVEQSWPSLPTVSGGSKLLPVENVTEPVTKDQKQGEDAGKDN